MFVLFTLNEFEYSGILFIKQLMEPFIPESNPSSESSSSGTIKFFDRKSLLNSKKRPKPIVYQIFLCSRCLDDTFSSSGIERTGAWAVLIQKCPQEGMAVMGQTAYLVSKKEHSMGNIEVRLRGLKEAMMWMTSTIDRQNWPYIEATLITSDIFLINLLREWLPKWSRKNFQLSGNSEEKRPYADLLAEIAEISTVAKINVEWRPDDSLQLQEVRKKADSLLSETSG